MTLIGRQTRDLESLLAVDFSSFQLSRYIDVLKLVLFAI